MAAPTVVAIPHRLGRDAARQRLRDRIGDLPGHVPGGMADVKASWPTPYQMLIEVTALGQRVTAILDIEDSIVRATFTLPALLSFMAGTITGAIQKAGSQALLPDK